MTMSLVRDHIGTASRLVELSPQHKADHCSQYAVSYDGELEWYRRDQVMIHVCGFLSASAGQR